MCCKVGLADINLKEAFVVKHSHKLPDPQADTMVPGTASSSSINPETTGEKRNGMTVRRYKCHYNKEAVEVETVLLKSYGDLLRCRSGFFTAKMGQTGIYFTYCTSFKIQ